MHLAFFCDLQPDLCRTCSETPKTIYHSPLLNCCITSVLQFTVGVTDKGVPPLSDSTSVSINIQRLGGPSFTPREYRLVKEEGLPVNTDIITLQADDRTPDVSSGNNTTLLIFLFSVTWSFV